MSDNFNIICDMLCIMLVSRSGIYAVADEASGFNFENQHVLFFKNFNDAVREWKFQVMSRMLEEADGVINQKLRHDLEVLLMATPSA